MFAYLITFAEGWSHATTSAITIMLIASSGSIEESVTIGLNRVIGTVIGAIIGMVLIALFPQEKEIYLITLSVFVTISLYLRRAYKGDATIFFLTALTMMLVYYNGYADETFLYGVNRTYMIILGIAIFTFIGIFLWPVKIKDSTMEIAGELLKTQEELYRVKDGVAEERKTLYEQLQIQEEALKNSVVSSPYGNDTLSREQKNTILQNIRQINELLMLLSYHDKSHFADRYSEFIRNFTQADKEITELFASLESVLTEQNEIEIPSEWKADYNKEAIETLSHIDRAELTATILDIKKLHEQLRALASKFNAILSPYPTRFELSKTKISSFNWWDIEDMKGALITFLLFWTTIIFWFFINPPAGFLIVTLATALSVRTTFTPFKPSLMIILFSFSFIFASAMYILVLPNIHYGWELGIFLFFYAFIGFYFINPQISIFFLMGLGVIYLKNPMYLNFQFFILTLLMFYLFLFILLLFYYIPFSTKPEVLFLTMKQRFFTLSANLLKRTNNLRAYKGSIWGRIKAWYARKHLTNTVHKMQLWAGKIDMTYFDSLEPKTLLTFTKECETFAYLLQMMYQQEIASVENRLLQRFKDEGNDFELENLLAQYAQNKEAKEIDQKWRDIQKIIDTIEQHLTDFFSRMKAEEFSEEEIIHFYKLIALRRNVWISLFNCQNLMEKIDFNVLKESRF